MAVPKALQDWYDSTQPRTAQRPSTMGMLARQGVNGDTQMAHVTPGEVVVPREVATARPDLMSQVAQTTASAGGDPSKLVVGQGDKNPVTGIQQFATDPNVSSNLTPKQSSGMLTGGSVTTPAAQATTPAFAGSGADISKWTNDYLAANPGNYQGVYDQAEKSGVSSGQLDAAMGGGAGSNVWDTNKYIADNKLNPLDGTIPQPVTPTTTTRNPGLVTPTSTAYTPATVQTSTYAPAQLNDPAKWNIDPSTQTVSGQMSGILASGSPLMQQADTQAEEYSNARGMLHSSMAAGASEAAMIAAATPIATTDAATYNNAAGYNAGQTNDFAKTNAAADNSSLAYNANATNANAQVNAAAVNTANATTAADNFTQQQTKVANDFTQQQTKVANDFTKQQALFEANSKASLAQINSSLQMTQDQQNIIGSLNKDVLDQMASINQSTTMDQQSKDAAITDLTTMYKVAAQQVSAVGSVPDVAELLKIDPYYNATSASIS